jgi:hypothetical protein
MKRELIILGVIGFLAFLFLCIFISVSSNRDFKSVYKKEIKAGNELVQRIDDYKVKNGSLPESLKLIYSESEKEKFKSYCYDIEASDYVLYFGTTLGEGVYYFSAHKEWCDYLKY